jgi:hypothetical protein
MKYILAIAFGTFLGLSFAAVQGYTDVVKAEISSKLS